MRDFDLAMIKPCRETEVYCLEAVVCFCKGYLSYDMLLLQLLCKAGYPHTAALGRGIGLSYDTLLLQGVYIHIWR